jgi:hypothetical protein
VTSPDPATPVDLNTPDFVAAALLNLRDTVKWMIASASAVAAVLVAGLQVKHLGDLADSSPLRLVGAAASALVALLLALAVVAAAVRVLAVPRLSVRDLSAREVKAGGMHTYRERLEPLRDRLIQSLLEQRTYLLGRHESITEFYREYVAILHAQQQLTRGETALLGTRQFTPGSLEDRTDLHALCRQVQQDAERLESAAQLSLGQMKFQRLADWLSWGGVLFAIAVLTFAWLSNMPENSSAITRPVPVQIHVRNAAEAGLPRGCRTSELRGIAVGGTFLQPDVITEAAPGCASTVIDRGAGVVVLPAITAGS